MTDEIFGPVLPVIAVSSIDEAIEFVYVYLLGYFLISIVLRDHYPLH
jgi:hypothetical protein